MNILRKIALVPLKRRLKPKGQSGELLLEARDLCFLYSPEGQESDGSQKSIDGFCICI